MIAKIPELEQDTTMMWTQITWLPKPCSNHHAKMPHPPHTMTLRAYLHSPFTDTHLHHQEFRFSKSWHLMKRNITTINITLEGWANAIRWEKKSIRNRKKQNSVNLPIAWWSAKKIKSIYIIKSLVKLLVIRLISPQTCEIPIPQ